MLDSPANRLMVGVLGEVAGWIDGQALELGGRRQRAVLAQLLVARGDVVPADRLIDALWREQAGPAASGALQAYVSHLRRRLEPGRTARTRRSVIVSEGTGYAVRLPDDAVDAWQFEQQVRAAASAVEPADSVRLLTDAGRLWRGPAFAEYADEPWAEAESARLTELRQVAREQLIAARLALGEHAVLVPEIEALVAEEPLREERWRLLVVALYRANRQGDALHALRRARHVLAEELGVSPGPALRALEAEVLAQSPTLDPPTRPVAGPSTPEDLVDRAPELAAIRGCLTDVRAGQGRLLVLEGPAGIGKSRLLNEVRRLGAQAGAAVLAARASRLEREYGFGVVRQVFEPLVAGRDGELLSGAAAASSVVFDLGAAEPGQRTEGALAALHGLYWLTVNVCADRPLVLTVDDLHWCDTGSLRFLAYLARRLDGLPVLVAATVRTGEPSADDALLAELVHDDAATVVRPRPLTADGTANLVRDRLGEPADEAFVSACHRTTSGNPLLLRQLLRALETDGVRPDGDNAGTVLAIGSRAVSSMVLTRLARMPAAATVTAQAVAVLGEAATLPAVTALAGLPEPDVTAAIAALVRAEMLRDEYPLGFVHPLVADAVYRDLPPGERQVRHEQAARALGGAGAPVEQIAAHLLQVPHRGDPWVVDTLRRCAAREAERGAPDEAAVHLARALAEPPAPADRADVLMELGLVEMLRSAPAALQYLGEALDSLTDPAKRAVVTLTLARSLVFAGGPGEASAFARRTRAELPTALSDTHQALTGVERIAGYMHGLDAAAWRTMPEPQVSGAGPGARSLAAVLAWETLMDGVDRARTLELGRFAIADDVLLDDDQGLLWVTAAVALELAGDDVVPFWERTLAHAYRRGSLFAALGTHMWRGFTEWRRGEIREAHESLTTAREQMAVWGSAIGQPWVDAFAIGVLVDLGEVGPARALVEEKRDVPRVADGAWLFAEAEAAVLLAEGRPAEALARIDSVAPLRSAVTNPAWRAWRSQRAQALVGLGQRDEAARLIRDELALLRVWGEPSLVGRALRLLGEAHGADGEPELREAVTLLAPTRARLEHARALSALAEVAPRDERVPLLRDALDLAQRCGARDLCASIAARLRDAGLAVRADAADRVLTRTEQRMSDLAADGLDERQIAQVLFLTPQSVRQTLGSVRDRRIRSVS